MSSSPRPPTDADDDARRSHQRHDGYTSDTVGSKKSSKEIVSPAEDEPARVIPSQWVAFSAEASSSLDRVSAWVSSSLIHAEDGDDDGIVEVGESSGTTKWHAQAVPARRRSSPANEAAVQAASSVVQTLNAFSTVAHVSGMGLKVVPVISAFSSLRAVNLSGNLIGKLHYIPTHDRRQ
jgi:transcription elongation factor